MTSQNDYILFFGGLGLILSAGICFILNAGVCNRLPWKWLGLAAAAQGLSAWLEMLSPTLWNESSCSILRICTVLLSYAFLFLFGLISIRSKIKTSGRWILLQAFAAVSFGSVNGLSGVGVMSAYLLCIPGGLVSAYAVFVTARAIDTNARRTLMASGACLALYSTICGAVAAGYSPSNMWVPKLICSSLAICFSALLWIYYNQQSQAQACQQKQIRSSLLAVGGLLTILLIGWLVTQAVGMRTLRDLQSANRRETLTAANGLSGEALEVAQLSGLTSDSGTAAYVRIIGECRSVSHESASVEEFDAKKTILIGMRNGRLVSLLVDPISRRLAESAHFSTANLQHLLDGTQRYQLISTGQLDSYSWGLSGIVDWRTGRTVALLGSRVDTADWKSEVGTHRLFTIFAFLLLSLLSAFYSFAHQYNRADAARISSAEGRHRSLFEGSRNVITYFDMAGKFTSVNASTLSRLAVTADQIIGSNFRDVWLAQFWNEADDAVSGALAGERCCFEADYLRTDGKLLSFYVVLNPVYGASHEITGFAAIWTDVTSHRQTEQELRFRNVVLSTQQDTSPDGILVVDAENAILSYNKRFVEMFSVPLEMIRAGADQPVLDWVVGQVEDPQSSLERVLSIYENKDEHSREEILLRDGRIVERYSAPIIDGGYLGRFWSFRDITDRKRAESELRENQERLNLALLSSGMGTFKWDILADKRIWDDQVYRLLGVSPGSYSGSAQDFLETIHTDDRQAVEEALTRALKEGVTYETEYRAVWPDGSIHNIAARGKVDFDITGRAVSMNGVCWDITRRKKIEELRALEREWLTVTLHSIGDAVIATDTECNVTLVNEVAEQITGVSEFDAIGRPIDQVIRIINSRTRRKCLNPVKQVIKTGKPTELDADTLLVSATGSETCIADSCAPIRNTDGEIIGAVLVFRDVTEQMLADKKLRDTERMYHQILNSIKDMVLVKGAESKILWANDAFTEYYGMSNDELRGIIDAPFNKPDLTQQYVIDDAAVFTSGKSLDISEEVVTRYNGQQNVFHTVKTPILDADGNVTMTVGVSRDITEQKCSADLMRENEAKYRTLFESSADGVFVLSDRYIDCNEQACRLWACDREDIIGKGPLDFSPEMQLDGRPSAQASREHVVAAMNGIPQLFYWQHKRKDGILIDTEICLKALSIHGETVLLATMRDISKRLQAERDLLKAEQMKGAVLDGLKDIEVIYVEPGMHICWTNQAADEPTGYHSGNIHGQCCFAALHGRTEPCPGCTVIKAFKSAEYEQGEVTLPDGRTYSLRSNPIKEADGRVAGVVHVSINITEQKRAEEELRIQTSAMNAASDQIIITDINGKVEFVNPAFEKETGYSLEEVIGKSPAFLVEGIQDEEFYKNLWSRITSGETWQGEMTDRRKDGSLCVEDMTITPVKNVLGQVEHFIAIKRNITQKKEYEEQLDYLAYHDPLTGLPNRLLFSDRLTQRLHQAIQSQRELAVMFLDIDRFKLINDTLGHNIGDLLLKRVAERLQICLREVDTIARMGGDEFTIILCDMANSDESRIIAQRIHDALAEPFLLDGHELFISTSIGVSMFPDDGIDVETLVKNADTAMYRAKEKGRNNYQLYTEAFNAADVEKMHLEHSLRRALDRDEFILHYQPQVDIRNGSARGVEALIRWQHPEYGLVPPGKFIPLAEDTGIIVPISRWVLRTACKQIKDWQDAGHSTMSVAVNVSAKQFHREDLVDTVAKALDESGLEPQYLELELTESALMENAELAIATLEKLKEMGVRIAVDDFGTGYSSLSYLKRFPIDAVKIDQSFVRDITTNPDDAAISGAVVAMAHSLKLKVIAEGVETLEQLEFLRSLKCDEVQGYFISRPVPADDLITLLDVTRRSVDTNMIYKPAA